MTPTIDHLYRHPEHVDTVARLIYDEFWTGKPGFSPAHFAGRLREASDPARIPLSLLALAGDEPIGTINLIDNDDEQRAHLHPWLAALVVVPAFRGRGTGTALVRALLDEASRLALAQVYFGTDGPGFYARLGAVVHEQVTTEFCIMRMGPCAAGNHLDPADRLIDAPDGGTRQRLIAAASSRR